MLSEGKKKFTLETELSSLNPYCIGRCSLSEEMILKELHLINGLNPYCIGRCSLRGTGLDDTLEE